MSDAHTAESDKAWDDKMDKEDRYNELVQGQIKDIENDGNEMHYIGELVFDGMTEENWAIFAKDKESFCEMMCMKINAEIKILAKSNADEMLE